MFIDSHAHLDITLSADKSKSLSELTAGVDKVLHISLNPADFLKNYPSFKSDPKILYAAGYYPDNAADDDFDFEEADKALRLLIEDYPIVAVGEAGTDLKHESYGALNRQIELFERQLALAEELNLPLVVHSRMSFEETYNSVKKYKCPVIMHCFSYGQREAELMLELGAHLSYAGILTYPKSSDVQAAALITPLDRVLFETDSPYLSPAPFRGKTNYPDRVSYVYEYFAKLRGLDIKELSSAVSNNFSKLFA